MSEASGSFVTGVVEEFSHDEWSRPMNEGSPLNIPAILRERLPLDKLLEFCARQPIKEMWVIGSVLKDWRADSDVDLLVRYLPLEDPLVRLDMQEELEAMLGRSVDLLDADAIGNPFVRDHIRKHRVKIYAA